MRNTHATENGGGKREQARTEAEEQIPCTVGVDADQNERDARALFHDDERGLPSLAGAL